MTQPRQPRVLRFLVSSALVTPAILSLGCPSEPEAHKTTVNPGPQPIEEPEAPAKTGDQPVEPAKTGDQPADPPPRTNPGPEPREEPAPANDGE